MKKLKILSLVGALVFSMAMIGATVFAQSKDDTASIQKAINTGAGKTVDITAGHYYINPDVGLNIPSNTTVNFDNGAILESLPSSNESYNIIKVWGVSNVKITGSPTIIGDRNTHLGTGGEHGMGISIKSASNVYVENANISNCWGDGIYVGEIGGSYQPYNKDVTIKNAKLDNNRRQGISVISVINLNIDNPTITNTNGTDPQSGIDFEPNNPNEYMQNVTVTNPIIHNNAKDGLHFWFGFNKGSKNAVSVNIVNSSGIRNNGNKDINFYKTGLSEGQIIVDGQNLYFSGSPIHPSINDLQKQIDDLTVQNARLQDQVKSLTDANNTLHSTNDTLSKKLSDIQNILNQ